MIYCRNGHPQAGAVMWDPGSGGPVRCIKCRVDLSEAGPDPDPIWPVVLVVLVCLTAAGVLQWLLWFGDL